jgi:uncharacterized membrane protein
MAHNKLNIGVLVMAILAVTSGVYPAIFGFIPETRNLFRSKPEWLLNSSWYVPVFMVHIGFGATALFSGSTQFFKKLRAKKINLHKILGKIYVLSVIPSGFTGILVGFYATGNWFSKFGFITLGIGWLISTIIAYKHIKKAKVQEHQKWMMRSYAFCFAFVTFRILLLIGAISPIPFDTYYS